MRDDSHGAVKRRRDDARRDSTKGAVEDAIEISKESGASWDEDASDDLERDYSDASPVPQGAALVQLA